MAFYLGLFAIMIIFMLLGRVTMSSVWAWLGVFMLAVVAGLRYETGNDFCHTRQSMRVIIQLVKSNLDFYFCAMSLTWFMHRFGFSF